ncbi:N-acetyltransferase [uncultured Nonlabens sp.]|uniref:GNAT family N-acetyltransferase n=1 Tax=uncultured Nonlabens sp. TaxID=859306 RepID=UPI002624C893|nr:N-acetyltransferase [uncultured Nonlabens sp.]
MDHPSTTIEITDNTFLRQYECRKGDIFAKIEYSQQERKIFLTKYIVPEELENDLDFRNEFLTGVFDNIREEKDLKVVPTHPKIAGFVRKFRNKYKDMLPVGIAI